MKKLVAQLLPHRDWLIILGVGLVVALFFSRSLPIVPLIILGALIVITVGVIALIEPFYAAAIFLISLPFERLPSLQISGVTIRISQIILVCLLITTVARMLAKRQWKLSLSPYFYPYILILLSILFSFKDMVNMSRGVQVTIFTVFTSLVIWILPALIIKKEQLGTAFKALFIVTILISIFGFYQFMGDMIGLPISLTFLRELYTKRVFGFPRVQATELEPLYLANFLIIPLSLALTFFIRHIRTYSIRIYALVILLAGLIMILTLSRGGYLGMAVSLGVIVVMSFFWVIRPRVVVTTIVLLAIVGAMLAGLLSFTNLGRQATVELQKHFFNVSQDASTQFRLTAYDQAWQAYGEHSLTGVGIGNYGPWVAGYPDKLPPDGWAIVNNEPLELLAETGVIGFGAILLFVIVLLARSFLAFFAAHDEFLRAAMAGLIAAFIGVVAQYQTFSTLYVMHIWALIGLMIATQGIIFQQVKRQKVKGKSES